MFSREDKEKIVAVKNHFANHYRISSSMLAPVMDRMVFAGGAFASLLLGEKPRDVDIFILQTVVNDWTVVDKYVNVVYGLVKKFDNTEYNFGKRVVWKCSEPMSGFKHLPDIDIIFTECQTAEEVIGHFDFKHSKVWYHKGMLNLSEETFHSIMDMKLVPTKPDEDIDPERIRKFLDRGWKDWRKAEKCPMTLEQIIAHTKAVAGLKFKHSMCSDTNDVA
jgi:hypothetical protein